MKRALLALLLLSACSPSSSAPPSPPGKQPPSFDCPSRPAPYPERPYFGGIGYAPNPEFLLENGVSALSEYYCPSAPPRLLIVRAFTAWCGPCQWAASHTGALLSSDIGPRLSLLDALLLDAENQPATPASLPLWQARYDVPGVRLLAPETPPSSAAELYWLRHYEVTVDGSLHLPLVVLLDVRDMKARAILGNPSTEVLLAEARRVLAELDGAQPPPVTPPTLIDGRFSSDEWGQIQAMALPQDLQPPPDTTNRYADRADAAALGKLLFNDEHLTAAGTIGCVTCHLQSKARQDSRPTGKGVTPGGAEALGDRNTPSLIGAGFSRWQFWDGRADSLWAQALGPFENPKEISSTRRYVVEQALSRYPGDYRTVVGSLPNLADPQAITAAFVVMGKSIAAFVRQIKPAPVALDRYARGDLGALTATEKDGLQRFLRVGCVQCHHGPMLTDGSFHANYFATGRRDCQPDVGREAGAAAYAQAEFRGDGPHSDDRAAGARIVGNHALTGKFRTPSLRGVADTAPYTHGGAVPDLAALVKLYSEGGLPDSDPIMAGEVLIPGCPNPRPARTQGDRDIAIVRFNTGPLKDAAGDAALVAFLQTLKAATVEP